MRKKDKKGLYLYLFFGIIFALAAGVFFLFPQSQENIYISSENPKQGDTVFVKIKTNAEKVTGIFENEKLDFYKKNKEWVGFLGVDADQKPGDYKIYLNLSGKEVVKNIKVSLADFSSQKAELAPVNKISDTQAVENIRKNDNPVINKIVLSDDNSSSYFSAPFSYPLLKLKKSGFSFGKFIGFGKYKIQHLGTDLRAAEDTDVYSVNDGKVVLAANLSNYGKTIIIDHGLNIFSMYLHLDRFKVSDGEMVKKGQLIGLSGDTGYVTAPHLHFSMRVGGTRVDPMNFIETTQKLEDNSFVATIGAAAFSLFGK